jgi:hypothetical protein
MGLVFKLVKNTQATSSISASYANTSSYSSYAVSASFIIGGGSVTPGGSPTQIQYNNSGTSLGGVPTLTYNGTLLVGTGSFSGSFRGDLTGTASFSSTASYIDGGTF